MAIGILLRGEDILHLIEDADFLSSHVPVGWTHSVGDVVFAPWFSLVVLVSGLIWLAYLGNRPLPVNRAAPLASGAIEPESRRPVLSERTTIEHGGVEWEYNGSSWPLGPFCPDDKTALVEKIGDKIVTPFNDGEALPGYIGSLVCLKCSREFGKGWGQKSVRDVKHEADTLFTGMENSGEITNRW